MCNLTVNSISHKMALLLICISIAIICYVCYRLTFPKNHQIMTQYPGPKPYPVIGNNIPTDVKENTKQIREWYEIYGRPTLVKMGPYYWVHLFRADHVEALSKDLKNIKKGFTYSFIECWLGKGLLTSTGEKWHRKRKLLTPTFHYKILNDFLIIMNEQSDVMVQQINKHLKSTTGPIDICPFITLCALDIICETSMGKELGSQTEIEMSPYVQSILEFTEISVYRMTQVHAWNDFLFYNFWPSGKRLKEALNIMHSFTKQVIKQRRADQGRAVDDQPDEFGRKRRLAFLDLLLEMERKAELPTEEIQEKVDTFMFEGHDTTATGIMWACYCFGRNPEIQRQGDDRQSWPTADQLNEMKHLERCVKESQRMYPPVPYVERTLETPLKIDDQYTIPSGCTVGMNFDQLHKDPTYFQEPNKWDPNRFLAENSAGRHPFAFCPFSGGLRNCIGQKFAMMEEKTVLCHLLRNFTFESVQEPAEMEPTYQFVLRPVNGVHIKITPRNPN